MSDTADILSTYARCVDIMRQSADAVLFAGACKLHAKYQPPDRHNAAAYSRWLHVILQKLCEVYAYIQVHVGVDVDVNTDVADRRDADTRYTELSTVIGTLNRAIMATAPSLHRCGVLAYMDECTARVNTCAGLLHFEQVGEYSRMRTHAAKLYRKFATGQRVRSAAYAEYTRSVAWAYRHFRQIPDCPDYMYATMCVAYYLSLLPLHPAV